MSQLNDLNGFPKEREVNRCEGHTLDEGFCLTCLAVVDDNLPIGNSFFNQALSEVHKACSGQAVLLSEINNDVLWKMFRETNYCKLTGEDCNNRLCHHYFNCQKLIISILDLLKSKVVK